MTVPLDFPDWTSGTTSLASNQSLLTETGVALPYNSSEIDCGLYQSLVIRADLSNGAGAQNEAVLTVGWKTAGVATEADTCYMWNGWSAGAAEGVLLWEVPARGDQFTVSMDPSDATATGDIYVIGSTRQIPAQRSLSNVAPALGALVAAPYQNLNQGGIETLYFGPVMSPVTLYMFGSSVKVDFQAFVYVYTGTQWESIPLSNVITSASAITTLLLPGGGLIYSLVITNTDTAAHSFLAFVGTA